MKGTTVTVLDDRELATVLRALMSWQRDVDPSSDDGGRLTNLIARLESGPTDIKPPQDESEANKEKARFVSYLRTTLIPDLRKSGLDCTANGFETCLRYME